ncbi:DsbA family protein [Mesorhizobium microcysteis]|jgi:protein-disulfide isomerase|uniref:DsbA family protein n=1 Tax=Neoaquamicrobium microcysteis TaxID=2682781 RepID=A0A5D4GU20_9HYPH|nr:DsbA family protein [Mesorhizobium microcysteis]TYR31858.1 DsbA family protein [Mesorhizobium microcysteis]
MTRAIPRRTVLASLVAVPASAMLLSACSDSGGNAQAQTSPTQTSSTSASAPRPSGTVDMAKLMEEGALPEKVLGEADAPVTIIEYASMTCGHCANFHNNTLPEIKANYIDTGKAKLIVREFPFDPRAEAGFMLARCADDRYFAMVDVLFKQQQSWAGVENARAALLQIARLAGFSQESFEACLTDQKLLDDVRSVRARGASEFGVDATPTFFINGNKYSGALTVAEMSAIIDSML